jgi:activator of HSP90 ATPase
MKTSFKIQVDYPVGPSLIYDAWLDDQQHSLMTGGLASCSSVEGGRFTAWHGYINGKNLKLVKNELIIQEWRTSDFEENAQSSRVIIKLKSVKGGSVLTLIHTGIPEDQPDYKTGWNDHYFIPMRKYFSRFN